MRRVLSVLTLVGLLVAPLVAQVLYVDDEQITVAAAAIGFTSAKITPPGLQQANKAVCRLELAEIRYRVNGLPATSSVGTLLEVGDTLTLLGHDILVNFSAIRTGSTSGQLDCSYFAQ